MRAVLLAFVAAIALAAFAAPAPAGLAVPHELGVSTGAIVLARGGCPPGWHPRRRVDRWGRWHVRCVPNRYY